MYNFLKYIYKFKIFINLINVQKDIKKDSLQKKKMIMIFIFLRIS